MISFPGSQRPQRKAKDRTFALALESEKKNPSLPLVNLSTPSLPPPSHRDATPSSSPVERNGKRERETETEKNTVIPRKRTKRDLYSSFSSSFDEIESDSSPPPPPPISQPSGANQRAVPQERPYEGLRRGRRAPGNPPVAQLGGKGRGEVPFGV